MNARDKSARQLEPANRGKFFRDLEMRTILANPKIVSSSDFYVRIRAFDGELPVNIDVERAAIDNVAGVSPSSNEFRWRIVETNLRQLVAVAESRHIQGAVTEGSSLGG